MSPRRLALGTLLLLGLACSGESQPSAQTEESAARFHCSLDDSCPELIVQGDPHARLNGAPNPYRGYGDPSLEYDPDSGTLWLTYSWLSLLIDDQTPEPSVGLGVRTHLARSDDGGRSFQYVRMLNDAPELTHPDSGQAGWQINEVSTLVRQPDDLWQVLWLRYFKPRTANPLEALAERTDFHYVRSIAAAPERLGDVAEPWAQGWATSPSFKVRHDLTNIPELLDCAALTEPALFNDGEDTYLATGCVVVDDRGRRLESQERLALLRVEGEGYAYIGVLVNASDARNLGADRLEQADLATSRTGDILLLLTPINSGEDPEHQGCVVFEVEDLARAEIARDRDGMAIPRAILTAEGNGLGPGLCTYDPNSETGVLMVVPTFDVRPDGLDIVFSLRATAVHP